MKIQMERNTNGKKYNFVKVATSARYNFFYKI